MARYEWLGFVNFLVFLFSVPILAGGIWLRVRASTDCIRFLDWPFIALGTALMLVSLAGIFAAAKEAAWLVHLTVVSTFLLVAAAFGFTVFAFAVTHRGAAYALVGRGYAEFKLEDGKNWLQDWVRDEGKWLDVRSCVVDKGQCRGLAASREDFAGFIEEDLSPIQSGCCKPPYECGYLYQSPTVWSRPSTGPLFNNSDCSAWSNDEKTLCYDCQSCKAGVVSKVKHDWTKIAILNIVFISMLFILSPIGCCVAYCNDNH